MKRKGNLGGIFAMALILVLTLVLSVGSVSAAEPTIVDSGNCGKNGSNVTWTLDSAGLLTISGTGEMADYEYNSTPWYDYKYKSEIKDAVITDGVTSIGDAAFYYCKGLISVTIPDSVTSLGELAFSGCSSLTSVTIGSSVTSIGWGAFSGCTGLTSVTIGSGVTSIGGRAFSGCTGLTSVTIPDSVISIGGGAFSGCTSLTSVEIPSGVTSIGEYAFCGCTGLKEVIYNAKAAADSTSDNPNIFENAGTAADGLKVIFGENVEKIPAYLFYKCTGLTSVTIGSNVTSIGDYAFLDCKGLVEINYNARAAECSGSVFGNAGTAAVGLKVTFTESVEKIPSYLFRGCTGLTSVTIGDSVTSIGYEAFSGCTGLSSVTIGSGVTSIGRETFSGCTNLAGVAIPDSVTSIGDEAFSGCTGLTSVTIGSGVTSIGWGAFSGCTGLTNAEIPNSVTSIEESAFSGCTGLTKLTIGSGVTSVGSGAFSGLTGLTEICYNAKAANTNHSASVFGYAGTATGGLKVVFGDSVEEIPEYLFSGCASLTSVTMGSNVTSIGNFAFSDCTGLTSIEIPESVTQIGSSLFNDVFAGCTNLAEVRYNAKAASCISDAFEKAGTAAGGLKVTFGENVEKIPGYLFRGCTGLIGVTIGSGVTSIGDYAFSGCTGLTGVTIGSGVTSIGDYAFSDCTGLTSVTIPDSVTSIGYEAFYGCTGLKEVIYNAKAAADLTYNSRVFENAGTAADGMTVVFGESVEKIPAYLFDFCKGLTNIVIPDSVTRIGDDAFFACHNIEKVHITDIAVWCGIVFGNYTSNPLHYTKNLYVNDVLVTNLTIPSSVTSIGDYAFAGCKGLTSVTIPDNVTSIGDYAFNGCTGLKEVIYNARAVADLTYDSSVFENAGTATDGLKAIFGESVEKIPVALFYDCKGLTSVIIGNNVTSIGEKAFYNCKGLVEISYNARAAEYSDYFAFNNAGTAARGLKVIFGESVEKIPDGLFYDCTALTGVTIGSNVTSIGYEAFSGCTGLTGIVLPGSVTSIENYAFYNCTGLTSVTIPDSVTSIGYYAFYNCTGLKEIIYNAKAAADLTYDSEVFENAGTAADGMKVVFGESVKKIPAYLLCGVGNIRFFVFTGNPPAVGAQALGYSNAYAFYTMHNSEWTEAVREDFGSYLTWIGYCTEPVSSAACRIDQTAYLPNDTLNTQGLCMTLTHKDGCTMTIPYDSGLLELGSCDMSTPGAKTIDVTYRGTTAQLKIYVHERKTQTLDKKGYPESSHNYENNLDKTYTYKAAGAVSLDVTFSAQTEVETNIDYLYVNGAQYTGTELAGKTISIQGDTLTIRLVSDKSDSAYGFSIDRIVKTYMEHQYKNGVCTLCGAKDPNYKLTAPSVKTDYLISTGKPYIKWAAVAGASKYEVYRSGSKDGTYTLLGTTANLNYTDSKANAGYIYYYKVKAVNANSIKSDYSATVAATCHCARPVVKPDYLISTGKPYIKWAAVAGASKYEVYRSGSKDGTYTLLGTTTATNYTDNKANAGYIYYYKAKAVNANSIKSDYSATVAATCHCARPVVKPDYLISTGKPYIKWTAVSGASKYYVYRSGSSNGTYKYVGTTTATNYTDNKANAGYTYYYKVKAVSKVSSGANSYYSVVIGATCHCARPSVKITTSNGSPRLTWNAVTGAAKYEVYRATSKNGSYTKMFTTSNLSYTNTSAKAGTTYYYKVKAVSKVKSTANSAFSTVVSIRAR